MENIGANPLEGSKNPIIGDPGRIDEKRESVDQKVHQVANKQLNAQNSQMPPSLRARASRESTFSDIEYIDSIVTKEKLSILEIDRLLALCKKSVEQKSSFKEENQRLLKEALSQCINNQPFQENLFSTIEKIRVTEVKIMKMIDIAKLPFLEKGEFKAKLKENALILGQSLIFEKNRLDEGDQQSMGGSSMVAFANQNFNFFDEEALALSLVSSPIDRFQNILDTFSKELEYIVCIGDKSFNCYVDINDFVTIKDKSAIFFDIDRSELEEGYKAVFKDIKDAATFLSVQNSGYLKKRIMHGMVYCLFNYI